jgi:hypothetical protein
VIDLKEFVEFGFLQEANRRFFHPLGLAMTFTVNEEGLPSFMGFQDFRDDPEGCYFDFGNPDRADRMQEAIDKESRVKALWHSKEPVRCGLFGDAVEPMRKRGAE